MTQIRKPCAEDAAPILDLVRGLRAPHRYFANRGGAAEAVIEKWKSGGDASLVAAYDERGAAGVAWLDGAKSGIPAVGALLREDRMGEKLGEALLRRAMDEAEARGAGGVTARISPANARALALVDRMEFHCDGAGRDGEELYLYRFAHDEAKNRPIPSETECGATIRDFRMGDEALVTAFFDRMGGESRSFFNRRDCNRNFASLFFKGASQHAVYWLAEQEGEMVGYVFIYKADTALPVLGIGVRDGYKGHGLGARLISHARDFALENGYGGLSLACYPANSRAQALYEKCGFLRMSTRLNEFVYYMPFLTRA